MTTSAMSHMICCAASAMVCRPDEQNRLIVADGTSTGNPARSDASRATLSPCDASGIAHPQKMSSIVVGSTPACCTAARITHADNSVGCTLASAPSFFPFPTADRTAETITASLSCVIDRPIELLHHSTCFCL